MDPSALSTQLKSAFDAAYAATSDHDGTVHTLCDSLANAIVNCVKTLSITYTVGLVSASPGSPVTGDLSAVVIS